MFAKQLNEIRGFVKEKRRAGIVSHVTATQPVTWPHGDTGNVVFATDTAVELGHPRQGSCSTLMWVYNAGLVRDGAITVIGPDLADCAGKSVPFGKIVLIGSRGLKNSVSYDHYQKMARMRFDLDLKGYMIKGVSQYQREWSRISKDAIATGLSFQILGSALIAQLKTLDDIETAEVIFVTTDTADIDRLKSITETVQRITNAMHKMSSEMSMDCDTCDYSDICGEVAQLKKMRNAYRNEQTG